MSSKKRISDFKRRLKYGGLFCSPPTDGIPFDEKRLAAIIKHYADLGRNELPLLSKLTLDEMLNTCTQCGHDWLNTRCEGPIEFISLSDYICPICRKGRSD